ncbi:hypothetical protein D9M73_212340 [compost metagenome]
MAVVVAGMVTLALGVIVTRMIAVGGIQPDLFGLDRIGIAVVIVMVIFPLTRMVMSAVTTSMAADYGNRLRGINVCSRLFEGRCCCRNSG